MSAHVMNLQLMRRRVDDPETQQRIRDLEQSGRAATARLRDLVFELHSPTLEEHGLHAALETLLDRAFEGDGVTHSVSSSLDDRTAPADGRDGLPHRAGGDPELPPARRGRDDHRRRLTERVGSRAARRRRRARVRSGGDRRPPRPSGCARHPRTRRGGRRQRHDRRPHPGGARRCVCRLPWLLDLGADGGDGAAATR